MAAVAFLAAAALAYWGYGEYKTHATQRAALSLVKDASLRLREALTIEAGPPPADAAGTVRKLDDYAMEVDAHLQTLRGMDAFPDLTLFDASDNYVLSVREFLRKQASTHQHRMLLSASTQKLLDHRLRASRRSASWIPEAVRLKERFEKDYRDYRNANDAFGVQFKLLPSSQKVIAPHVASALLIEDKLIAQARQRALETSRQTVDEAEKTRKITSVR